MAKNRAIIFPVPILREFIEEKGLFMPQMNKGGKFIFGRSRIREEGSVRLPDQAVKEYGLTAGGRVYLFTGSRSTGGFCVTRRELLEPSKLGHILRDLPELRQYAAEPGAFLPYKERSYCWVELSAAMELRLPSAVLEFLGLTPGMGLLAIRSSDIAYTMGAKGPLLERAARYGGVIPEY